MSKLPSPLRSEAYAISLPSGERAGVIVNPESAVNWRSPGVFVTVAFRCPNPYHPRATAGIASAATQIPTGRLDCVGRAGGASSTALAVEPLVFPFAGVTRAVKR